jgi:hypothetical protein
MINLKRVTLFTILGNEKESFKENNYIINKIINSSTSKIKFGKIKVLSAQKNLSFDNDKVELIYINPMSLRDYNFFMVKELNNFIDTDYVLSFQNDGFILNPELWNNDFLNYDYIGAPWPDSDNSKIGNGGFSLRSKKFLEFSSSLEFLDNIGNNVNSNCTPEDHLICRHYYNDAIKYGIKFAPTEIAKQFSYEMPIDNDPYFNPLNTFGFHGVFQNGMENDPFRILIKKLFFNVI